MLNGVIMDVYCVSMCVSKYDKGIGMFIKLFCLWIKKD